MTSGQIRVLCADDHPLILDGLARLLERERDMVLVAEANNGNEGEVPSNSPGGSHYDIYECEEVSLNLIRMVVGMPCRRPG